MRLSKKILTSSLVHFLIAFIASIYIRLVYATSRWTWIGKEFPESYLKEKKPFITCFWHGRLLMLCYAWPDKVAPFYMLISSHRDGQLISRTVGLFGIKTIKGSTRRGGIPALRQMIQMLNESKTIGITPDGPRGPRHTVSLGIVQTSYMSKADIIPVTFSTSRGKFLKSWDRFFIAFPFSKGVIAWGQPIPYPINKEDFPHVQRTILESLIKINHQADSLCNQKESSC
jgi:lysophospholipid acyltransferase (LPLAT)-like uncharacterized protein